MKSKTTARFREALRIAEADKKSKLKSPICPRCGRALWGMGCGAPEHQRARQRKAS